MNKLKVPNYSKIMKAQLLKKVKQIVSQRY